METSILTSGVGHRTVVFEATSERSNYSRDSQSFVAVLVRPVTICDIFDLAISNAIFDLFIRTAPRNVNRFPHMVPLFP